MNKDDLNKFLKEQFPQVAGKYRVADETDAGVALIATPDDSDLRPGGTLSGPSLFGLADVAFYLAILSRIGPKALTVTTNCSIDFMRKPAAGRPLRAEARILKLGKVLAVGDVLIYSEGQLEPVARASLTYSIPPEQA